MSFLTGATFLWQGYQLPLYLSKYNISKCFIMGCASVKSSEICSPCYCKNLAPFNPYLFYTLTFFLNRKYLKNAMLGKKYSKQGLKFVSILQKILRWIWYFFLCGNGFVLFVLMYFFNDVFLLYIHFRATMIMFLHVYAKIV